jgi:hypothetical protein
MSLLHTLYQAVWRRPVLELVRWRGRSPLPSPTRNPGELLHRDELEPQELIAGAVLQFVPKVTTLCCP